MGAIGRIQRTKKDILPFTDHLWMVSKVRQTCPLPWVCSFAMYFTQKEEDAKQASRCYQTRYPLYCTVSKPTVQRAYCQKRYGYLEVCDLIGVQRIMVGLCVERRHLSSYYYFCFV